MNTDVPTTEKKKSLYKKTILIIEDDRLLSGVLKNKLTHAGFSVLTASDGEEGLEMSITKKPDLILLDIIMPKMNGIDMLKKLREDAWGKSVPVLLLTNDDNPEHVKETLQDNATDYLIKTDWDINAVIERITETLRL
jgi:two-component system alkaline phosphatase synthesis response regulator PhoP